MKILRITSEIYPYTTMGGIGVHTYDLSVEQVKEGHQVTVCTCSDKLPKGPVKTDTNNYSIYNIGRGLVIAGNTICLNLIPYLLKHVGEFDVVHAHSHLFLSTLCTALVRKAKKFPLVVTNHGLISQTVPAWFQNLYNKTAGKLIFRTADGIVSYTEVEKDIMVSLGAKKENVSVIHNGIKLHRFQKPNTDILKKKQIIWVGRYVKGKGAKYLLEGFAEFSKRYPEYNLLMIGTGPELEETKQLITDLAINDKVIIKESVPNEEMQNYYYESEVLVSTALAEGVPKTMLEAMFCGLPVISTDLPQLIDIVEGCGLIIPTMDSHAVCEGLSTLANDANLRKTFGENGTRKIKESYNWDNMVKGTLKIYADLIKKMR